MTMVGMVVVVRTARQQTYVIGAAEDKDYFGVNIWRFQRTIYGSEDSFEDGREEMLAREKLAAERQSCQHEARASSWR